MTKEEKPTTPIFFCFVKDIRLSTGRKRRTIVDDEVRSFKPKIWFLVLCTEEYLDTSTEYHGSFLKVHPTRPGARVLIVEVGSSKPVLRRKVRRRRKKTPPPRPLPRVSKSEGLRFNFQRGLPPVQGGVL